MDNFPAEILSDIFRKAVIFLPSDSDFRYPDRADLITRKSLLAPFHISQVCHAWRKIALNDGRLWSYFVICGRLLPNRMPIIDVFLARTKEVPLNYTVVLGAQNQSDGDGLVTALTLQQHRWENVLFGCGKKFLSGISEIRLTNMPMLTSFVLSLPADYMRVSVDFTRSTKLRRVNIDADFELLPIAEPLRYLTLPSTLNFRSENDIPEEKIVSSCLNFLKAAPFLEELSILVCKEVRRATRSSNCEHLTLAGLRRLKLNYGAGLFHNITLPSLDALHYESKSYNDIGHQSLANLLHRSRPHLTFLCLRTLDGGREEILLSILHLLPTLEHLFLQDWHVTSRFYRELTLGRKTVCPKLGALLFRGLVYQNKIATCAKALITMLNSRAEVTKSFASVTFRSSFDPRDPLSCASLSLETAILSKVKSFWEHYISGEIAVGEMPEPFKVSDVQ